MKYILLIIGILLILISLFYFSKLIYYIIHSYELTNFGYGILVGKIIILIVGISLIYFGIKKKK